MTKLEARFLPSGASNEVIERFRAFIALPFKAEALASWLSRKPRGVNWIKSSKSAMAAAYATRDSYGRVGGPIIDEALFQELTQLGMTGSSLREPLAQQESEPDQLTIDLVPYAIKRINAKTLELGSDHFAKLLFDPSALPRDRGFWAGAADGDRFFVAVTTDVPHATITFRAPSGVRLRIDHVADWFRANLSAIYELGYEVLSP